MQARLRLHSPKGALSRIIALRNLDSTSLPASALQGVLVLSPDARCDQGTRLYNVTAADLLHIATYLQIHDL